MATQKKRSPEKRLEIGASVLAAARAVDTRLVKDRLQRFEEVHRTFVGAQRKVDGVEAQMQAVQARLAELDAAQDGALAKLACSVSLDRESLDNPFEAFGFPPPKTLIRRPFAEEAAAIHQLVAAVLRGKDTGEATRKAAHAADKAAREVEEALALLPKIRSSVREARRTRDAVGQRWEAALRVLRRHVIAAADEGAPELYVTLFPPVSRAVGKPKPPEQPAGTGVQPSNGAQTTSDAQPTGGAQTTNDAQTATPNAA